MKHTALAYALAATSLFCLTSSYGEEHHHEREKRDVVIIKNGGDHHEHDHYEEKRSLKALSLQWLRRWGRSSATLAGTAISLSMWDSNKLDESLKRVAMTHVASFYSGHAIKQIAKLGMYLNGIAKN